jgi:hypothetical protein
MQVGKRSLLHAYASLCAGLCLTGGASADDDLHLSLSGFGTIGGTYTGNSGYTYVHNDSEFKATNSQFDLGLDSRIGAQATITYGSKFTVIVEEEAKRRGSENFSLGTEWAFIQYSPTPEWKLRVGRVALATFLESDSRDVGYAQPWFHAPNELYGSEPFETLDGAQALWHSTLGPVGLDLEGEYGTTSQNLQSGPLTITVSAKSAYNVAASLTYDSFLFRVAETEVSFPFGLPLSPSYTLNFQDNDKFLSLGFQYDDGSAILLAEWAKRTENDVPLINLPLNESSEWYVAGGWRFGKWTPLVMYGKWDASLSVADPAVVAGTWSASLRYDVVSNLALKAQFSRPPVSSQPTFSTPDYSSSQRVNVFSLGADFVF